MYDVITIGAATIDTFLNSGKFLKIRSNRFATGVGECFSLGSKVDIDNFVLTTGGGATNAAATFRNLGLDVGCVAAVGDDVFGRGVLEDFRERGISRALVSVVAGENTAFSVILVMASGERTVLVARGVSERLSPKKVPWNKVKAPWVYMTSLGGNMTMLKKVAAHAKKNNVSLFWNPGSKDLAHGTKRLLPIFRALRVLDVNREEAADLTGKKFEDLSGIIKSLASFGVPVILLTDGERGAYAIENGEVLFVPSNSAIRPVNRTGAGDAFGSGWLTGYMASGDVELGLKLGALNAQSVIQKIGAKTGLLRKLPSEKEMGRVKVKEVARR